jgi:glyoxylase I family protein
MIQGIEHTAIASPDPIALGQWYVDNLGFVVNYQSAASKTTFVKAPNGYMLEIVQAGDSPRAASAFRDAGLRHLAILVNDFDAVYGELKAKGVKFLTEPEASKGNKVVFFSDLDGNFLHLLEREKPLP